jgi:hypothetical protein
MNIGRIFLGEEFSDFVAERDFGFGKVYIHCLACCNLSGRLTSPPSGESMVAEERAAV